MANHRWEDDDPYRPRRYGNDEEYERNFWRDNESRGRDRQAWGRDEGNPWRNERERLARGQEPWPRDRGPSWRGGEPSWRGRSSENPVRRNESMPVLGMDFGGEPRSRGDWRRFDESSGRSYRGFTGDTDWSNDRGQRDSRGERGWWDRTKDEVRSWMGDVDAEHRREEDYRGRGPRGYARSDERIREDVSDWLTEDRYVDASEIDVAVAGGEVTLTGTVSTREMKRRAENIAAEALGVKDVHNSLRVRQTSGYGTRAGETAGTITGTPASSGTETTSVGGKSSMEPRH
jgi:osmotically-inducible protein OsmY